MGGGWGGGGWGWVGCVVESDLQGAARRVCGRESGLIPERGRGARPGAPFHAWRPREVACAALRCAGVCGVCGAGRGGTLLPQARAELS